MICYNSMVKNYNKNTFRRVITLSVLWFWPDDFRPRQVMIGNNKGKPGINLFRFLTKTRNAVGSPLRSPIRRSLACSLVQFPIYFLGHYITKRFIELLLINQVIVESWKRNKVKLIISERNSIIILFNCNYWYEKS